MRVRFTSEARADLRQIGDSIAKDNPSRALSFVDELEWKCASIGQSPEIFSLVPGYEVYGIRCRLHRDYLIFYRIDDEDVVVIHILHGAMDYVSALFVDEDISPQTGS